MAYIKRMMESKNPSDQRLLKLYQVRQANHAGINIGFNNQDKINSIQEKRFAEPLPIRIDDEHNPLESLDYDISSKRDNKNESSILPDIKS